MKYHLYLKKEPNKKGELPIYIRAGHNSKYKSTGLFVLKKNWDLEKKLVKRADPLYLIKNKTLKAYKNKADKFILNSIINDEKITPTLLINHLKTTGSSNCFYEFANSIIATKNVSKTTLRNLNSRISTLKKFRAQIDLNDIDEKFVKDFHEYFKRNDYRDGSIKVYFTFLSEILSKAQKKNIIKINPFDGYKFKAKTKEKEPLEIDEIVILEKLFKNKTKLRYSQKNVLLNFLFCTYTGISLVDLERITQDSIKVVKYKDIDYHIIKDNRQKSDTGFITILTSEALELIKIRKKESNSKFIFHVPSCMFYQMDIIRKKSGIEKHFTFHTSRHSFGTYWANKGVSEKVIMKMMGHKSKSANRIYSKILTYGIISETLGKDYKEDH